MILAVPIWTHQKCVSVWIIWWHVWMCGSLVTTCFSLSHQTHVSNMSDSLTVPGTPIEPGTWTTPLLGPPYSSTTFVCDRFSFSSLWHQCDENTVSQQISTTIARHVISYAEFFRHWFFLPLVVCAGEQVSVTSTILHFDNFLKEEIGQQKINPSAVHI